MKSKRYIRGACFILVLLIILGSVIWGIFTRVGENKLRLALDSASTFSKTRIIGYDNGISNDRVKSLIRLLDKAEDLRRDMIEYASFDQSDLDSFVTEQRLTGVLILDDNMNVEQSSAQADASLSIWQNTLGKDYIQDLLDHKEATYTEQTTIDNVQYDFVLVSRDDAPGLLMAYVEKESESILSGENSIESLFENYPLEMDGKIIVRSDDMVVSSTDPKLIGITSEAFAEKFGSSFLTDSEGIFRIKADDGVWFGRQENVGNYILFVLFPSRQIFFDRLIAMALYCVFAIIALMVLIIMRGNIEKHALQQSQQRLRIITALGTAYSSISLINLENKKTELLKAPDKIGVELDRDLSEYQTWIALVDRFIAPEYRDDFFEFVNMTTICQRLNGEKSVSIITKTTYNTWLEVIIVPQKFDDCGNIVAVLLACRNITTEKEKELEQEQNLRNALAYAEHANKAKTNFLNSISHDIRTPMNAIIGYTTLATTHIDNRDQVMDYLQKISTSSQHLLSLINDVLDMSRIESGVLKLDEGIVHLPDVFHDLRSIILGSIVAKQHDFYIDTQNVIHEDIITDKLRLNQVLLNIVGNAVKFTPAGGMINIRVEEKPSSRVGFATYIFSVKDNGIGISKEFQSDIFEAFAREQTTTKSGIQGTGLGMAISKNIVDMMGGTIKVNSELGKGSEFIVTVDFRISGQTVSYQPIPELRGARALVVDDDMDTCRSVCNMLRQIDMSADWTTTGKEAVFRANEAFEIKQPFKVFIIDWQMPDMNGLETVRRIRKVIGPDTPIIILTAYDWADIANEAKEAGVTAFISKPIFMSELRAVLTQKKTEFNTARPENSERQCRYQGLKVLLVEDNALNSEIAATILEEAGLKVDAVPDGIDAVERMASAAPNQYDVILMDIQMPKMDGYTATREIRTLSDNRKANIPIIAMTANAFEEDKEKAIKAGMNGHVSKPIDLGTIMSAFDMIFGTDK